VKHATIDLREVDFAPDLMVSRSLEQRVKIVAEAFTPQFLERDTATEEKRLKQ